VHDHGIGILEAGIAGQRLGGGRSGLCHGLALEAGQTGCSQRTGATGEQATTRQGCGLLHGVSLVIVVNAQREKSGSAIGFLRGPQSA
jgi:hypothetical protein